MRNRKISIGCDPAFRANGFCISILDEENTLSFITFKKFTHFISWVQNDMPGDAYVAIENSYLQNRTFDMRGNKNEVARKSRNVGLNQAVSEISYQLFCEYAKVVKNISPAQKGAKIKDNMIINALISQHGIKSPKKKFNQDERDAFKLLLMI